MGHLKAVDTFRGGTPMKSLRKEIQAEKCIVLTTGLWFEILLVTKSVTFWFGSSISH